ncbi:hypothetical protein D3C76_1256820 [compost metagenome]
MIRGQHQAHFIIKHRRIVQAAARQNIGSQHQIQLALLQRRLRVKGDARFKVHLDLRIVLAEILQRGRQPLNTAVALDGDAKARLLRFIAGLQRTGDLRQHLISQLQ